MRVKVIIFFLLALFMGGFFMWQQVVFRDNKLHIVFCDVGQGDAIFVRTPAGANMLFDGGPGDTVLECLSRHMPFWERTLSLVFLSHPHEDHLAGLLGVVGQYNIGQFGTEMISNDTFRYKKLYRIIQNKNIPIKYLFAGNTFKLSDGVSVSILSPTKEYLDETSPNGKVGEKEEFASVIPLITYGNFKLLLTGDSQANGLRRALQQMKSVSSISVLQIPHHGSKTGLTQELLDALKPNLAVISVGLKNKYNHPAKSTLELLQRNKIPLKRTDRNRDIEIVSDGKVTRVLE